MQTDLSLADNNTPIFSLEGLRTQAKCTSVYDGDTAYFAFRVNPDAPVYRYKCRMAGYNSAELRTKDPAEKTAGLAAKNALLNEICGKIVTISVGKYDMYGRLLVTVFNGEENVNQKMILGGYGKPYSGRGKKEW
jgi:endonuclease YncB( thermonuclease family)